MFSARVLLHVCTRRLLADLVASFAPLPDERTASTATAVRDENRHDITLPFAGVFADQSILHDPDLPGIVLPRC